MIQFARRQRWGVLILIALLIHFGCANDSSGGLPVEDSAAKFSTFEEANDTAKSVNSVAGNAYSEGDFNSALTKYKEALDIWEGIDLKKVKNDSIREAILDGIIKSYQNLAFCYGELKKPEQVKILTQKCLQRQDQIEKEWHYVSPKRRGRAYRKWAEIIRDEGSFEESVYYLKRAEFFFTKMSEDQKEEGTHELQGLYNELSNTYLLNRKAEETVKFAQMSIDLANNPGDFELGPPYSNLGYGLLLEKKYDQGLRALYKAYNFYPNIESRIKPMHNAAMAERQLGHFNKAHAIIDTAIAITRNNAGAFEPLARRYSNKADIYFDQQDFGNALAWYDQSIKTFLTTDQGNADAPLILDKAGLVEAYEGKAKSLAALQQFDQAMAEYKQAIALINAYKFYYADASSKIQLAEITKKVFENAIHTALQEEPNPSELLALSEQSKAFALLESVKKQKVLEGIDPQSLEKEKLLRQKIYALDKEFSEESDSEAKGKLLTTRQQLQDELNGILQILNENERYRQVLSDIQPLPTTEIQQKLLSENQAMLEYFVGEDQSYLFFLPKSGTLQVVPLAIEREHLNTLVNQCLLGIYGPYNEGQKASKDSLDRLYFTAASNLYNLLIPSSIRGQLPRRLMVVTDDVLGYMPFGALLTTANAPLGEYKQYDYLGQEKTFSYCYSAALWQEMHAPRRDKAANKLLSFAFSDEAGQFNTQESDLINALGSSFIKSITKAADVKTRLEKIARRYRYLHFATHGVLSDTDPNESFLRLVADDKDLPEQNLYLYDIYGMTLNADMVFISACDAGIGRLARGEGIMSLARGFSYAGAGSIITALWKINQSTSNELVTHFYEALKTGLPKDEALYKAQKQYLKSASKADAAPYFWACFIPVGDMSPVQTIDTSKGYYAYAGGALLLCLLVFWGYRRRNKKYSAA